MLAGPEQAGGIHKATSDDLPLFIELINARYAGREPHKAIPWICWCLTQPTYLCLAGKKTVCIAGIGSKYGFEHYAVVHMLTSRDSRGLEALKLLRLVKEWATNLKLRDLQLDADTDVDFGPFARRLGGHAVKRTRYSIPLGGK